MHLSKQTEEGKGPRLCQIVPQLCMARRSSCKGSAQHGFFSVTPVANAQATGRDQECIDLYRILEDTHPNIRIKRQAANLRFIMEAPKLKLGPDERVSIPVLATPNRFACAPVLHHAWSMPMACMSITGNVLCERCDGRMLCTPCRLPVARCKTSGASVPAALRR